MSLASAEPPLTQLSQSTGVMPLHVCRAPASARSPVDCSVNGATGIHASRQRDIRDRFLYLDSNRLESITIPFPITKLDTVIDYDRTRDCLRWS